MAIEIDTQQLTCTDPLIPSILVETTRSYVERFLEKLETEESAWFRNALYSESFFSRLCKVWGASPFVFETCLAFPGLLRELLESGDLTDSYSEISYQERLRSSLATITTEKELHAKLRQFRRREMVRIVWRDFSRDAATLETTGDVTRLAEACIVQARDFLYASLCQQFGTPIGKTSGEAQELLVLGMGKMGAWELNVSSDIDLIFVFPESGETRGGRRELSNQEFFIKLGQKLIQALDNNTVDGFVFRVDMRLRPYGESGALALNFDALEEYLHTQGRDWERYAMIKARIVAGSAANTKQLMQILRPFTYRKYIDFSAIQSLRDMKAMISREVARMGIHTDVKKGAGGIREIEFIAQAFQLIRGGKDQRFQTPELQKILRLLDEDNLLPDGAGAKLWQAYLFLRDTEHAIQGHKDQQTQALPDTDYGKASVATVMGFAAWDQFTDQMAQHRALVTDVFAGIASESVTEQQQAPQFAAARALWLSKDDAVSVARELESLGFIAGVDELARGLVTLRDSKAVKALAANVKDRLDTFMPQLLSICREQTENGQTLLRILPMVQGILRRSTYLVLLIENPEALYQLVRLCRNSIWIAEQLSLYPALLDELLDPRTLYSPASRDSMAQELRQLMLRIPEDDLEAQMDVLRYFRRAQGLRIAACEVTDVLPLMKVSDNLTWLAEVILEQVLVMAWRWIKSRHGLPGKVVEDAVPPGFLIIGYGKLGGLELGHSSDLDLVFVHNGDPNLASEGEKSIDNGTYFNRLGQRVVHILTAKTTTGSLYEVDMRLRPNGNSGLLVPTITAFEKYQRENAWTWEHQALVRARPVAGDGLLAGEFAEARHQVLSASHDEIALRKNVSEMRGKMRVHLGTKAVTADEAKQFDIKQDEGGIVDIEFIVQYLVLSCAHRIPTLLQYPDNMRILDAIRDSELLPADSVAHLQEAYLFMRSLGHRLNLQGQANRVDDSHDDWQLISRLREQVSAIWQQLFGAEPQ